MQMMVVYDQVTHQHLLHGGRFWDCAECHPGGWWFASRDFGIAVRSADGTIVMDSEVVGRLLVP